MCAMPGWLLLVLLAQGALLEGSEDGPLAVTSLGRLRGAWLRSAEGRRYAGFMTVPYAKPPVGHRRFEPPEAIGAWQGEWDASQPAPLCLQFSQQFGPLDTEPLKGQEDCLFLNVYTPRLKSGAGLPVLVYIHGGAFMFGGSEGYGAKFLMDRDVVLVTLNYRLGPLGFLSLEDAVLPGNLGLRDQTAALHWIQQHVASFGGDPGQVTLSGCSAGGASVHYHFLAPPSRGLFRNGLSLSGTALSRWALADSSREKALRLAALLGCPTDTDSHRIVECLRSRPAEAIVKQVPKFQVWQYSPFSPFAPVVESHSTPELPPFLPDDPVKMLARGEAFRAPWVTGVTTHEGLYPVASFIADPEELSRLDLEFESLVPHLLHFNFTVEPGQQRLVARSVRSEYFGDQRVDEEHWQQLIKMASDRLFVVDSQRAAELQSRHSPVYFYQYGFRGAPSLAHLSSDTTIDFGAGHADDTAFFMHVNYVKDEPRSGQAKAVEQLFLDLWTSFAATGVPSSAGAPSWTPVAAGSPSLHFLRIAGVPALMASEEDLGNAKFWESLPLREPEQSFGDAKKREEL